MSILVLTSVPLSTKTHLFKESRQTLGECSARSPIRDIEISADDQFVLAPWTLGTARLWEMETGSVVHTFTHGAEESNDLVISVAISPDNHLISTSDPEQVKVWETSTGALLWEFPQPGYDLTTQITFVPNQDQLLVSRLDGASLWSLSTGEQVAFFPGSTELFPNQAAQLSVDGRYLVTNNSHVGEAYVWDTLSGEMIRSVETERWAQTPIAFASASSVVANEGDVLRFWDISTGITTQVIEPGEFIEGWRLSDSGQYVLIERSIDRGLGGYPHHIVELWDVNQNRIVYTFEQILLNAFVFLPSNEHILVPYYAERRIEIWHIPSRRTTEILVRNEIPFYSAFTSDGERGVMITSDAHISVWEVSNATLNHVLC